MAISYGELLFANALKPHHVSPGVTYAIIDIEKGLIRRGTFTSSPKSFTVEGATVQYAETEPDANYGVSHVYFGDAGIAPLPNGQWHPRNVTVPGGLEACLLVRAPSDSVT